MVSRKDILDQALKCVNGDRDEQYGNPEDSFKLIADFWMSYLNNCGASRSEIYIRSKDVAAMLALLKVARISGGQSKLDNWIDLAGYAACGGEIESTYISEETDSEIDEDAKMAFDGFKKAVSDIFSSEGVVKE